jgi:chorismate--pyruvate lyase
MDRQLDPLRQGMNGHPAAKSHTHPAPRWTERLADWTPAAPDAAAAWLREPGLLTERLRACCAGETGLVVVSESEATLAAEDAALLGAPGNAAFVREIELTCAGRPWVFAQTLVPQATLARQQWLATLGRAALGERLASVPGIERGPLEYARLAAGDRLYRSALRERPDPPAALWARRSWYAIEGQRLLVQEVFLPESHA